MKLFLNALRVIIKFENALFVIKKNFLNVLVAIKYVSNLLKMYFL